MRLVVLSLAALLLGSEAWSIPQVGAQPPVFFLLLHKRFMGRVGAAQATKPQGSTMVNGPSMIFFPSPGSSRGESPFTHVMDPSGIPQGVTHAEQDQSQKQIPSFDGHSHRPSLFDQQLITSHPVQASQAPNFSPAPESPVPQHSVFDEHHHTQSHFEDGATHHDEAMTTPSLHDHGSHPDRNPACYTIPDGGECRASFARYFFDPETGTCNCYLYGGCREDGTEGERPGSYFTLSECHQECHPPNLQEGPICKEIFDDDEPFLSFLATPDPKKVSTDHLKDDEFLSSFSL